MRRLERPYDSGDSLTAFFSINDAAYARSGLKMSDAESGIKDVGALVSVGYRFANGIGITGMASVTQLLGDASDSPVTDDQGSATQLFGGALVSYSF